MVNRERFENLVVVVFLFILLLKLPVDIEMRFVEFALGEATCALVLLEKRFSRIFAYGLVCWCWLVTFRAGCGLLLCQSSYLLQRTDHSKEEEEGSILLCTLSTGDDPPKFQNTVDYFSTAIPKKR